MSRKGCQGRYSSKWRTLQCWCQLLSLGSIYSWGEEGIMTEDIFPLTSGHEMSSCHSALTFFPHCVWSSSLKKATNAEDSFYAETQHKGLPHSRASIPSTDKTKWREENLNKQQAGKSAVSTKSSYAHTAPRINLSQYEKLVTGLWKSPSAEGVNWKKHPTSETQTLLCLSKQLHIAVCNSKGQGSTAQEVPHVLHSEILAKANFANFSSIFPSQEITFQFHTIMKSYRLKDWFSYKK